MHKLALHQYSKLAHLVSRLSPCHLSIAALLAGTVPGQVWVDDLDDPRVALLRTPEGHYLAGDAHRTDGYSAIKETLPHHAYLILDPPTWAEVLDQIWVNRAARRHPRLRLLLHEFRTRLWRHGMPEGYRLAPVDRALLARSELKNHGQVAEWVEGWHSTDDFLQNGFGYCLVHKRQPTIAAWCIADSVLGERCEMGVTVDAAHRRRGLATVVVSAAVEQCLERGFTEVGWHCLASNAGSLAVARKVGFEVERAYDGYSFFLPAENPTDLSQDEYRDWALHYERVTGDGLGYSFHAAEAWAMAGEPKRALRYLRRLPEMGWQGRPEWVEHNWRFDSLRDTLAFRAVMSAFTKESDTEETCETDKT